MEPSVGGHTGDMMVCVCVCVCSGLVCVCLCVCVQEAKHNGVNT